MRARLLSVALCLSALIPFACAAEPRHGGWEQPPRFEDFPGGAVFSDRNRLVLGKADMAYRTRLREAARQKPNFAGHYVLALWGCGMECVMGAAIDVRSGRVTWLPGTVCCWYSGAEGDVEPVRCRPDSRLIVLNGLRDEREGDGGEHYYTIEQGRFVHLVDVPSRPERP